jgi:hypothetical protein
MRNRGLGTCLPRTCARQAVASPLCRAGGVASVAARRSKVARLSPRCLKWTKTRQQVARLTPCQLKRRHISSKFVNEEGSELQSKGVD